MHEFHPGVNRWFEQKFGAPTLPQARGWPAIASGAHTLIAAPTGSGKTLAAFLAALDRLFRQQLAGELGDETKVLYVSPLKALSNDIHRNLTGPLEEIQKTMEDSGFGKPVVRAAVRTGDTTASDRQAMVKRPPHVLVTTPESFYLLLTSKSGRAMLGTVETLIVDEIHALAGNRRGAHLALSMERLHQLVERPLQRIGLSATQRPMDLVARYLVGERHRRQDGSPDCEIVDEGHLKELTLSLEVPESPLEAVMAGEVWEEIYRRMVGLIQEHKTTLIFVNTRRLAERVTFNLKKQLGEDQVTSHHGSLSLKMRHQAETRLKEGRLKALVATASLELGIDIGYVDLVCQLGSPRSISTLLQRVGRSGHYYGGVPKGALFPLTRDELVECTALIRSVREGSLDRLTIPDGPMDILAQQIVAAAACEPWKTDALFELVRQAYLYRTLEREKFDDVVHMLADGFGTKRGKRGAHLYFDGVNGVVKGRKGARLTALTSGGAIPDNADYSVVLEPESTFIGTLNEDFAIESLPGDIFQLGNHSWRILKIETGKVRVEDAGGLPPTIPFWLGEAPSRTDELSAAVSNLRKEMDRHLEAPGGLSNFMTQNLGLPESGATQIEAYFKAAKKALGHLPTQEHIVMERFFDEGGGMQLVIHAPFGSRLNRAWGLALRKRFCRSFNFELQAAANEDAIVLSLGPKHSFPLEEVLGFLNANTVREVLIQALLDAPMFQTRWRWNASRSLALPRHRGGKRVPPQIQRMEAEDLIAVVFPDQLACLENIAGDREVPDHPLVSQTIEDCLTEAMDIDGLVRLLQGIAAGSVRTTSLDLPEPSPLAHEVLSAKPYAFLDDAPLEERRTQAVYLRRSLSPDSITEQGLLDKEAIDTVRAQAWPAPENTDEAHEALMLLGGMAPDELAAQQPREVWTEALPSLMAEGRAGWFRFPREDEHFQCAIAAEKLPLWQALYPRGSVQPELTPPARDAERYWEPETALLELLRGRIEVSGPVTADLLAEKLRSDRQAVAAALLALEVEGLVLRGHFDPDLGEGQWCERGLLARIHRLTINRLRAKIKPVAVADFMRFLFQWQRVGPENQAREVDGLEAVIDMLEGYEAAADRWEQDLLPARVARFSRSWLDQLCLSGRVAWCRISPPQSASGRFHANGPLKTTPISLFPRANGQQWCRAHREGFTLSTYAAALWEIFERRGALFFGELRDAAGLLHTHAEMGLGELVALGLVTCDSFAGLRALLTPAHKRPSQRQAYRMRRAQAQGIEFAGRWSRVGLVEPNREAEDILETHARTLLKRYGVVFRRLLDRESNTPPWRDLLRVYRRLEAIGEVRGGRFVERFSGEQFALPEAVGLLRSMRNRPPDGALIELSAHDPLNMAGLLLPGTAVPQITSNRILFRDGLPIAALIAGKPVRLAPEPETMPPGWDRRFKHGNLLRFDRTRAVP